MRNVFDFVNKFFDPRYDIIIAGIFCLSGNESVK